MKRHYKTRIKISACNSFKIRKEKIQTARKFIYIFKKSAYFCFGKNSEHAFSLWGTVNDSYKKSCCTGQSSEHPILHITAALHLSACSLMSAFNSCEQDSFPLTTMAKGIPKSSSSTVALDFGCLVEDVLRDLSGRKGKRYAANWTSLGKSCFRPQNRVLQNLLLFFKVFTLGLLRSYTVLFFFLPPITNSFVTNHPLQCHHMADVSLTTAGAVGDPWWITSRNSLALLSNDSWPLSLFPSCPFGLELLLTYSAVSSPLLATRNNSPHIPLGALLSLQFTSRKHHFPWFFTYMILHKSIIHIWRTTLLTTSHIASC